MAENTAGNWTTSDYVALTGSLLNAGSNVYAADMGRRSRRAYVKLAKEMAQYNNEMAEKHWRMQVEYNSPANQMMRYKEAGLNPNLIYGQSNEAGLPSTPTAETPNIDSPVGINPFDAASSAITAYQNIKGRQIANTNAAIVGALNEAKTENEIRKGTALDINNEILQKTSQYQVDLKATELASEKFMLNYKQNVWLKQELLKVDQMLENLTNTRVSRRKNEEEITNLRYQRRLLQSQIELNEEEAKSISQTTPAHVAQMYGSARLSNSSAALNEDERAASYQLDPFTQLPLYKLNARNKSGLLGYQAIGQRNSNNLISAQVLGQRLKNRMLSHDWTNRYLDDFGKMVGIATKAAVPYVGGALLGRGAGRAGYGSYGSWTSSYSK